MNCNVFVQTATSTKAVAVPSDLGYPVLVYPDPSPSGRKSLVTDSQHMQCIRAVCVFGYPVPSPIRIFFCGKRLCAIMRGLTVPNSHYSEYRDSEPLSFAVQS